MDIFNFLEKYGTAKKCLENLKKRQGNKCVIADVGKFIITKVKKDTNVASVKKDFLLK